MEYKNDKETWRKAGIYKISNKIDDRIYIGSTNNFRERFRSHRNKLIANKNASIYLQRFCNKYDIENLTFEIIEVIDNLDELIIREDYYIQALSPAFNLMSTAIRQVGAIHSEETKLRMKEIALKSFLEGRSSWNKGMKLSEEQKSSYKECSKGIPRNNNKAPVCLYARNGIDLIECFDSMTDAQDKTGVLMSSICNNIDGKSKKTKAGIWKRN